MTKYTMVVCSHRTVEVLARTYKEAREKAYSRLRPGECLATDGMTVEIVRELMADREKKNGS